MYEVHTPSHASCHAAPATQNRFSIDYNLYTLMHQPPLARALCWATLALPFCLLTRRRSYASWPRAACRSASACALLRALAEATLALQAALLSVEEALAGLCATGGPPSGAAAGTRSWPPQYAFNIGLTLHHQRQSMPVDAKPRSGRYMMHTLHHQLMLMCTKYPPALHLEGLHPPHQTWGWPPGPGTSLAIL
jgi:hypothetical protein